MKIIIPGTPVTKKNSQRIVRTGNGRTLVLPSKAYTQYEKLCGYYIPAKYRRHIDTPITLSCLYYMPNKRRVDLCNLLEATCDILVKYGVIADDNSTIVMSHDGSRVYVDRDNPRVEIEILSGGIDNGNY